MHEIKYKNGVANDFPAEIPAPYSVKLHNAIEANPKDYVVVQLRVEVFKNGEPLYSLQTGPINPGETKAVFFKLDEDHTFDLVIETNRVTSWVSTQWDVLHTQVVKSNTSRNFVAHGNPDNILLHVLSDM